MLRPWGGDLVFAKPFSVVTALGFPLPNAEGDGEEEPGHVIDSTPFLFPGWDQDSHLNDGTCKALVFLFLVWFFKWQSMKTLMVFLGMALREEIGGVLGPGPERRKHLNGHSQLCSPLRNIWRRMLRWPVHATEGPMKYIERQKQV